MLRGASHAIARVGDGAASAAAYALAVLDALTTALPWGLAGGAAAVACRLAGAMAIAQADRTSRTEETFLRLATRAIAAIERLAEARELPPTAQAIAPASPPDLERQRFVAEIDQAARAGRWDEAASLLDHLGERFPGDPAIPAMRERLETAGREQAEGHLARLDAARKVNDAERVLELYRAAGPLLESERRGDLERDLAGWFLDVIRRRLRVGRIQVNVVHLATQVADTFAATAEGASLRASLATLRRSVGLCPRCGQPYTGTAAACPKCLAGPSAPPPPEPEMPDDIADPE
jgi:hypothetical protein